MKKDYKKEEIIKNKIIGMASIDEYLVMLWITLHNLNCEYKRLNNRKEEDIIYILDKIGVAKKHENPEELIIEAEEIIKKHGGDIKTHMIILK